MRNYIFLCFLILLLQFDISLTEKKFVEVARTVDSVNKNKYLPWKADSYGYSKVDLDLFAKTKLGIILPKPNASMYKGPSPRNVIKKATLKPADTDYMGLPVNFTWANPNATKCAVNKIRDQSNCGSCWVSHSNFNPKKDPLITCTL